MINIPIYLYTYYIYCKIMIQYNIPGELETLRQEVDPLRQALQEMQHLRSEPKVDLEKSAKLLERLTKSEDQNSKLVEVVETVREQLTQALKQIVQNEVISLFLYYINIFLKMIYYFEI